MKDSSDRNADGAHTHRFIIDSSGWIEYFSAGKLADKYAKYLEAVQPETYVTPSLILFEVYKKLRLKFGEEDAIKAIVHIQAKTTVIDIDTKIAIKSADMAISENLPMADAIVYGTAAISNAKIITSDKHFKGKSNIIFIE